jgi:hypothetical protein
MARRRFKAKRAYARPVAFKRSRRTTHSTGNPLMTVVAPAFIYGAIRPMAKQYAAPITDKLPLGANSDEVAFGLLGYYMHKKGTGFIKNAGTAILTVEAASLGNNIGSPLVSGSIGGVASPGSTNQYMYG